MKITLNLHSEKQNSSGSYNLTSFANESFEKIKNETWIDGRDINWWARSISKNRFVDFEKYNSTDENAHCIYEWFEQQSLNSKREIEDWMICIDDLTFEIINN